MKIITDNFENIPLKYSVGVEILRDRQVKVVSHNDEWFDHLEPVGLPFADHDIFDHILGFTVDGEPCIFREAFALSHEINFYYSTNAIKQDLIELFADIGNYYYDFEIEGDLRMADYTKVGFIEGFEGDIEISKLSFDKDDLIGIAEEIYYVLCAGRAFGEYVKNLPGFCHEKLRSTRERIRDDLFRLHIVENIGKVFIIDVDLENISYTIRDP